MTHPRLLMSASVTALLIVAGAAQAQAGPPVAAQGSTPGTPPTDAAPNAVEEVVVTADKTGTRSIQRAPEAVSVVTGAQLASQGLRNVSDIAPYIPNVTFSQNTASAAIYIRGIGSNNVNAGSDPDVTTQIDGVYIARPSGQLSDFIDVQSIEVLRGPQGTLFGRNAVGGVVNIISRTPSHTPEGRVELTGGNYGLFQGAGYVTGPLADKLYGSLAFNYIRHDAYFHNIAPGGHDVGEANHGGIKGQLRWEPTETIDATTRVDVELGDEYFETFSNPIVTPPFAAPLTASVVGSYRDVALDTPQRLKTQFDGVSEELNWRFAPGWSLKSISGFRNTRYKYRNDSDATELRVQDLGVVESDRQYSQEFDLNYKTARFNGVAGLYYFHDEDHERLEVTVPPSLPTPAARSVFNNANPQIDSTSGAIFAQGSYDLTSKLSIVLGARYTGETKSIDQSYRRVSLNPVTLNVSFPGFPAAFSIDKDYYAFTPKAGLNLQLTPDALLYFAYTRGFKSGGFNFGSSSPVGASFAPEKITSYEGGAKTEWLGRRLRINLTGFYYDYSNLQVQQLLAPGVSSIGNAATAEVRGIELEVTAKPTSALQLTVNISGLDPTYDSFPAASVPGALVRFVPGEVCTSTPAGLSCSVDASGNRLNSAPTYSGLVAADYTWKVREYGVTAHLDYTFRGRAYFDPSNVVVASQGAYGLLSAHVGVTSPDRAWGVEVYGKNLTDKGYYLVTNAGGVTPDGQAGDPRTYGVRLTHAF